jgi:hypothetical protein
VHRQLVLWLEQMGQRRKLGKDLVAEPASASGQRRGPATAPAL